MYSGAFGGKNLSTKQIEMIRPYMVVLSLDSDKAGTSGLLKMAENLWASGIKTHLIRPPAKFKDWNKMLEELGPSILLHYIDNYEKELDMVYFANLFMK